MLSVVGGRIIWTEAFSQEEVDQVIMKILVVVRSI